jgi:hypothetical protein
VVRSGGEGASRLGFGGFIAASHRGGRGGEGGLAVGGGAHGNRWPAGGVGTVEGTWGGRGW